MLANKQLDVQNREASPLQIAGKTGIKLTARENDGVAWLNGVTFSNGVIELDIKGKDVLQQSFVGVAFHGTDIAPTKDVIYFRPFNFRAADPVRKYTPYSTNRCQITIGKFYVKSTTGSTKRQ